MQLSCGFYPVVMQWGISGELFTQQTTLEVCLSACCLLKHTLETVT